VTTTRKGTTRRKTKETMKRDERTAHEKRAWNDT